MGNTACINAFICDLNDSNRNNIRLSRRLICALKAAEALAALASRVGDAPSGLPSDTDAAMRAIVCQSRKNGDQIAAVAAAAAMWATPHTWISLEHQLAFVRQLAAIAALAAAAAASRPAPAPFGSPEVATAVAAYRASAQTTPNAVGLLLWLAGVGRGAYPLVSDTLLWASMRHVSQTILGLVVDERQHAAVVRILISNKSIATTPGAQDTAEVIAKFDHALSAATAKFKSCGERLHKLLAATRALRNQLGITGMTYSQKPYLGVTDAIAVSIIASLANGPIILCSAHTTIRLKPEDDQKKAIDSIYAISPKSL